MKLEYTIPESKKDISLKKYLRIIELYKMAEKNETDVDERHIVSVCLGIPINMVEKIPFDEYQEVIEGVKQSLASESVLHLTFELKGVKYGFINDLENMTAGEYAHLDQLLKDADKNAYRILNVLYRPIIKEKKYKAWFSNKVDRKYLIEPYNKDRDVVVFEDAPYEMYESALVFFYNLSKQLVSVTLKYMKEEEQQQMIEQLDLVKNGAGIKHLIPMLQQSESELKRYTMNQSIKYSLD